MTSAITRQWQSDAEEPLIRSRPRLYADDELLEQLTLRPDPTNDDEGRPYIPETS